MAEQKIPKGKYELMDWLKELWTKKPSELEKRVDEIIDTVKDVMRPLLEATASSQSQYYQEAVDRLEAARQSGDFKKEFPLAIHYMAASIEYE